MNSDGKKCMTDCREDLIFRINKQLPKAFVWKFASISIALLGIVWGGSYAIYADGVKERKRIIESNQRAVAEITTKAEVIKADVEHIRRTQEKIEQQNSHIMRDLQVIVESLKVKDRK